MYVLLSLVAGVFTLWAVGVGACILLGWRRKSLISTVKRLAKWHAGILAVLGLLLLDLRPCVTTPLMSTAEKAELKQGLDRESDASRHRISVTGEELSSGLRSAADLLQMELHSEVVFPESDRFQLRFALGHPPCSCPSSSRIACIAALLGHGRITAYLSEVRRACSFFLFAHPLEDSSPTSASTQPESFNRIIDRVRAGVGGILVEIARTL